MKFILVVILGDVNVGKSNIIRRILGHDFQELEATVGVEFGLFDVKNIDPDDPSVVLSIQIWDTCKKTYIKITPSSWSRKVSCNYYISYKKRRRSFISLRHNPRK